MADRIVYIGSSRSYTTIQGAITGESDFQTGEDNIVFTIDAGSYGSFDCNGKFTTSSSHRVIFTCASGAFHGFTRGSGVRVVVPDGDTMPPNFQAYCDVIGMAFTNPYAADWYHYAVYPVSFSNVRFFNCMVYDTDGDGIVFTDWGAGANNGLIVNSAALGITGIGIGVQYEAIVDDYIAVYNCVALNCGSGFGANDLGTSYFKNCYAGLCTTGYALNDYVSSFTFTTCASDDGSQSSTVISIANCHFTSSTDGSEDIRLSSSSSLIGAGTSLSSDSIYAVTVDAWGTSRASSPCLGPYEYAATGIIGSILQSKTLNSLTLGRLLQ